MLSTALSLTHPHYHHPHPHHHHHHLLIPPPLIIPSILFSITSLTNLYNLYPPHYKCRCTHLHSHYTLSTCRITTYCCCCCSLTHCYSISSICIPASLHLHPHFITPCISQFPPPPSIHPCIKQPTLIYLPTSLSNPTSSTTTIIITTNTNTTTTTITNHIIIKLFLLIILYSFK